MCSDENLNLNANIVPESPDTSRLAALIRREVTAAVKQEIRASLRNSLDAVIKESVKSSISTELEGINTKFISHDTQLENLASNLSTLNNKVEALASSSSPAEPAATKVNNNNSLMESMSVELLDRQARSCNVLLFGLAESSVQALSTNSQEEDRAAAHRLLSPLHPFHASYILVRRMGRPQGKPRPLIVTLPTQTDAIAFLKNKSQLKDPHYIVYCRVY